MRAARSGLARARVTGGIVPVVPLAVSLLSGLLVLDSGPYFGRAYTSAGQVCFELPDSLVDWSGLAIRSLGEEAVRHPSPETLEQHFFEPGGVSEVRFVAAVTPALQETEWLILHETGFMAVRPTALRGEIVYHVDSSFRVQGEPLFLGEACASPGDPAPRAAFVVSGLSLRTSSTGHIRTVTAPEGRLAFQWRGHRYTVTVPKFATSQVKGIVLYPRPDGPSLALLAWRSAFCESAYSLFEVSPDTDGRLVAENGYNCDA
jgi:hypothetical protein